MPGSWRDDTDIPRTTAAVSVFGIGDQTLSLVETDPWTGWLKSPISCTVERPALVNPT